MGSSRQFGWLVNLAVALGAGAAVSAFGQQRLPADPIRMAESPPRLQSFDGAISGFSWLHSNILVYAVITETRSTRFQVWRNGSSTTTLIDSAQLGGTMCATKASLFIRRRSATAPRPAVDGGAISLYGVTEDLVVTHIGDREASRLGNITLRQSIGSLTSPAEDTDWSTIDCSITDRATDRSNSGSHDWLKLNGADGWLRFSTPDVSTPGFNADVADWSVSFHANRDAPGRNLAIDGKLTRRECVRLVDGDGRYFVIACHGWRAAPSGTCLVGWWLTPANGRLERVCVPNKDLAAQGATLLPRRGGWTAILEKRRTTQGDRSGGIYSVDPDGRATKLFNGFVSEYAPSPDGCWVAFRYTTPGKDDERDHRVRDRPLAVIHVCGGSAR
ncbi:MAG: hypothetical protein IPK81_08670 [Rhodospirillales bacterium]|nr:MAG: hypothetical protein IPK81_08670 [Rhodospirillales bacterium]